MLKLENLSIRVNAKSLLSSINLEIIEGEVEHSVKRSGKTTIVSAIAGIIHPVKEGFY